MSKSEPTKSLEQIAKESEYPIEAFQFVREGLQYTVQQIHGKDAQQDKQRHIGGRQLCHGLHKIALQRWGLLAQEVLRRWNVTSTMDFGSIVFAMIEHGWMMKTDQDRLEDFLDVYDFNKMFNVEFTIEDCDSHD